MAVRGQLAVVKGKAVVEERISEPEKVTVEGQKRYCTVQPTRRGPAQPPTEEKKKDYFSSKNARMRNAGLEIRRMWQDTAFAAAPTLPQDELAGMLG